MKYLDLREFHEVTAALNFDTSDSSIIGGCDAYTTKAAGTDKKLHKQIENSLESQHNGLLAAVKNLPPTQVAQLSPNLNLERDSPFGSLQSGSNRRKFAYLIATLNATHYDYDFSHTARPQDFARYSMRQVMHYVDREMYNLRPHCYNGLPAGAQTPLGSPLWSPRMWQLIDGAIELSECEFYCWLPSSDPFDGEDGSIESWHYFIYNKNLKRVCYLYFRRVSALSTSETRPTSLVSKYKHSVYSEANVNAGARKRAEYWLGDRASKVYEDEDDGLDGLDNLVIDHPYDEIVDAEEVLTSREREASQDYYYPSDDDSDFEFLQESMERQKSAVRAMDDHVAESIEI